MSDTTTTTQATVILISGLVLVGCGAILAIIAMVGIGVENKNEKSESRSHRAEGRVRSRQ